MTIIPEEETIAVVNNKKISLAEFQTSLQLFQKKYKKFSSGESQLKQLKDVVIKQLIEQELIRQEAARKGIKILEEELDSQVATSLTPYAGAEVEMFLQQREVSKEEWTEQLRDFLVQKKLIEKEVLEKIPITKREIETYRKEHRQDIVREKAYHVRNITLSTKKEAKKILRKLRSGQKFVNLIREHSISPDRAADGDLGYIQEGNLPPELEAAVFKLGFRSGRSPISGITQSQDGFHILVLLRYRSQTRLRQLGQRDAKALIKEIFIKQKRNKFYKDWMKGLKEKATISVDQAMLASEEGF